MASDLTEFTPTQPAHDSVIESPLLFTGSGSEYFRIWIVNILLLFCTLGLYYPWAKVRRLRYFYNHTEIDGYSLDFHGRPWRMLRSMLLVGVFFVLYANAGNISPVAGLAASVSLVLLWPALFRAVAQFRLANTSWRGKRFRFVGTLPAAYLAVGLPVALLLLPFTWVGYSLPQQPTPQQAQDAMAHFGLVFLLVPVLGPWCYWLLERYLHGHLSYADQQSEFRASVGKFYGLAFSNFGVGLLVLLVMGSLVFIVAVLTSTAPFPTQATRNAPGGPSSAGLALIGVAATLAYLSLIIVLRSYWTYSSQNLIWTQTGNALVRLRSQLEFWPLIKLTAKNWLLMLLTLGFYWPFATVASYRIRLQAVTVVSRQPLEQLSGGAADRQSDAAGDMAADLGGFDFGL